MKNEIIVKRDELHKVYENIKEAISTLQFMLAEIGCVHRNKQNLTTFTDVGIKRWYCSDCDQTFEEEIEDDLV